MLRNRKYSKGVSIIELLVVMAIIGIVFGALISFGTFSLRTAFLLEQTTQASFLVQDTIEALKNYRDNTGWFTDDPGNEYDGLGVVATGVSLYPNLSLGTPPRWQFLAGQETIDIFTREVVIEPVLRDGADNIVESGGTVDPSTKKATVRVFWQESNVIRELETITYLTNWR